MFEFWMVWKEGGGAPTHTHESEASARREAERLAVTVGGTFYILKSIAGCSKPPAVVWFGADPKSAAHPGDCRCDDCSIPF